MNTIWTTAADTATWRFAAFKPGGAVSAEYAWMQWNFITDGDFSPTATYAQYSTGWQALFAADFFFPMPTGLNFNNVFTNYNTASRIVRTQQPVSVGNPSIPRFPVVQNGACIILRTIHNDRSGIGRIHWPWITPADVDGSRLLPSFEARFSHLFSRFTSTFTLLGVDHRFCIWSRKLGRYSPVISYEVLPQIMYLRKRRLRNAIHGKKFAPVGGSPTGLL